MTTSVLTAAACRSARTTEWFSAAAGLLVLLAWVVALVGGVGGW